MHVDIQRRQKSFDNGCFYLLHLGTIATRLKAIFQHAADNWETVQEEWLQIFTSTDADFDVKKKLEAFTIRMSLEQATSTSKRPSGKVVIDEARFLLAEGKTA